MKRKRVYISGPITHTSGYRKRFRDAAREIFNRGDVPVNPALLEDVLPDGSHVEYMLIDIKLLELCDAIYMLDGWSQSAGARTEYAHAKMMHMIIEGADK